MRYRLFDYTKCFDQLLFKNAISSVFLSYRALKIMICTATRSGSKNFRSLLCHRLCEPSKNYNLLVATAATHTHTQGLRLFLKIFEKYFSNFFSNFSNFFSIFQIFQILNFFEMFLKNFKNVKITAFFLHDFRFLHIF